MSRDTPDTPDLDEIAAWCRGYPPSGCVTPRSLMSKYRLTRNAACSALEALEARGVLDRIPGQALAWKLAPAPPQPARGYSLPLSPAEHGALLRALDSILEPFLARHGAHIGGDVNTLRRLRSRLLRKDTP